MPNALFMILLVIILLLIVFALYLMLRVLKRLSGTGGPVTGPGAPPAIPDHLTPGELSTLLQARLAGTPADGSAPTASAGSQTAVVWADRGDEVVVHLDSVTTDVTAGCVLVSIDLETDQTGRTPLVTCFALADSAAAGLVVATDEFPRGNPALASRWGAAVQAAAWSALLSVAADHATERGLAPAGLTVSGGRLRLLAADPLQVG